MQIPAPRLRKVRADCLESSFAEKNPRLLISKIVDKLTKSQQCTLVAKKGQQCGQVGGNPSPLHSTGEATPGQVYPVQEKHGHAKVLQKSTKMMKGLKHLMDNERLRSGMFILENRGFRRILPVCINDYVYEM